MTKIIFSGVNIYLCNIYLFNNYLYIYLKNNLIFRFNYYLNYYFIYYFGKLFIFPVNNNLNSRLNWSTFFKVIINDIIGLKKYHFKTLILKGVGYKVFLLKNKVLGFDIGFSYLKTLILPRYINFKILNDGLKITFFSIDNILLGDFVNYIINIRKYNVYTGKGILYLNKKYLIKNVKKK